MCTSETGERQGIEPGSQESAHLLQPAGRGVERLPTGEVMRAFDLRSEDAGRLIQLKEEVYGNPVARDVFAWEYFGHPRASQIRVFVCEGEDGLHAATTRLPATLLFGGASYAMYFNIESMVHPAHRRKGRMRDLYRFARTRLPGPPLMMSKGSADQIYPMLLSIGQRPMVPNTFLVNRPSMTRRVMSRLHLGHPTSAPRAEPPPGFEDAVPVTRFGASFDAFFARVARQYTGIFARDAAFMNWRYVDIPHRRYAAFMRLAGGEITGVAVLALRDGHGHIVDLVWDPVRRDEPERTIRLAQRWLRDSGAANVLCFATYPPLRASLGACGFVDTALTPRFSAFVPPRLDAVFAGSPALHVVDGDGDTEFS